MTADDFVKLVRKGSDKLRVDDIILTAGDQALHGKGTLQINREDIKLDMTLDAEQTAPTRQSGVLTKSDYWKLTGLIEDCLRFKCDHVSESGRTAFISWDMRKETLSLNLNPIELIPSGWDALSPQERARIHQELRQRNAIATQINMPGQTSPAVQPDTGSVYFLAQIYDYSLPTLLCKPTDVVEINPYLGERRGGRLDTIMGEIEGYDFAFIEKKDPTDLHVHLESKEGYESPSQEDDWRAFYALMKALAFTLGVHAWPYRIEYWRGGQKIADLVTPASRLSKTLFVPFRLATFNVQDVIKKATAFFVQDNSKLHREVAEILFLFREAADHQHVHFEVTLVALCVLFESLVNQMFKELKLADEVGVAGAPDAYLKERFDAVITSVNELFKELKLQQEIRLRQAQGLHMRERFEAVVKHFKLPWQDDMEAIFKTWQKVRDPIVHGGGRTNQSEAESKGSIVAASQIAGGINILVLKLIGYSGPMCASVFEEKYRDV